MLHFAKSLFFVSLDVFKYSFFFKVALRCQRAVQLQNLNCSVNEFLKKNQKTKPKPLMQMNLKYVLPEDKNEYISAGCW